MFPLIAGKKKRKLQIVSGYTSSGSDALYDYYVFTNTGTPNQNVVVKGRGKCDFLLIGGGGTGVTCKSGSPTGGIGGGGGAGDYVPVLDHFLSTGTYPAVIAGAKAASTTVNTSYNGDDSTFRGYTSIGGGGGEKDGASGGGSSGTSPGTFRAGGTATGINGNDGGDHTSAGGWGAGGGGGAGSVGGNNSGNTGGAGGSGIVDTYWLGGYPFCVGGGGASESGSGGNGYGYGGNGANGAGGSGGNAAGYGAGGGGARNNSGTGGKGGDGGAGVLIIRILK